MQRSAIIVMHKLGFKKSDIVYWVGHDERTINHWINHFDQFNNVEDESRNGRPRATTDETDQSIVSMAEEICFITPKEIRSQLQVTSLHAQCVGGSIKQVYLVELLEFLIRSHRRTSTKDLHSYRNYGGWNESQWNTVLFSDETHVILGGNGQVWVQRPEDTAFLSQFMIERDSCSAIAACSVRFHRAVRELQQFVVSQKSLSFSLYIT